MNKIIVVMITSIFLICLAYAQVQEQSSLTEPQNWISKNTNDTVTINNGPSLPVQVTIVVDKPSAGINLKNCGTTSHVDAGSTALCASQDASNPISFTSDSGDQPATGHYQIKQ